MNGLRSTIAYHYTIQDRAAKILDSYVLKRAVAGVIDPERPILWLSSSPNYDPTAFKCVKTPTGIRTLSFQEMLPLGLWRFLVPKERLIHWSRLWKQARMSKPIALQLERVAVAQGADPNSWFGSLTDLPLDNCVGIEVFREGQWIDAISA